MIQFTPLLFLYLFSAVITLGLTAYGIKQYWAQSTADEKTILTFTGIVLSVSIWTVSRFFQLFFTSKAVSRFWVTMVDVGLGGVAISALFFGFSFAGRKHWVTRRNVLLVSIIPVIAVFVAATNQTHQLFWSGDFATVSGWYGTDIIVYKRNFKLPFYGFIAYAIGIILIGLYIGLRVSLNSAGVYRRQTVAFATGAIVALVTGVLFAIEKQPVPGFIDLTPMGFAGMGLCFGYAIFRHQLLDLVPVARDTVIESMRDGYVVLDTEHRIVDFNNAAKETLDADDDIVGETIDETLPACAGLVSEHEHGTLSEKDITIESDGEQRFLVANVTSLTREDTLIGRLLLLRDVTERRTVQKRYQALIENSSDLILVTEPDGEITYASPSVATITGVEPEEIIGENSLDFIHEEDQQAFRNTIRELLEMPGEKRRQEYRTMDSEGNWLYMEASIWNLLDNPFVEGLVVNAREITERKEREQELEQANEQLEQTNEQLEQFAGVISHDLRNPINVARGHTELARDGNEESFEKIESSLQRMEAIIDDVLTLAREGESIGETEPIELSARARRAWDHVATEEANLEVANDVSFEADPDRLLQLFENLFRNSIEHAGSDVTVRVGLERGTLYVEDDGPGIPADKRNQVLESGHTTNPEGTGLGLSIVSQIADAHGWEVEVTEGTDGGARFEFLGVRRLRA